MAAEVGEDVITRASTTAAEQFVDSYYNALDSARPTISTYYMPKTALPAGKHLPIITYNGLQLSDPSEFQSLWTAQMPYTFFEVQSLNATVLNPSLVALPDKPKAKEIESNMSLLVQVSGYVRLFERKDGPQRGFSDHIILVPNKEEVGAKGKDKTGEGRSWLIQSQNFRFVV